MARRVARKGPRSGLGFWGCTRWPACGGVVNIDASRAAASREAIDSGRPAAYAQRRFDEERARERVKHRALLPVMVAVSVITMTTVFFGAQGLGLAVASVAATLTGAGSLWWMLRLPADSIYWARGVEGERRAAEQLEPLLGVGYIVLYGRLIPGMNADIDSLVIGPSGVFVVETKNWSGKLRVVNDRLFVGDNDRSWVVEQLYRNAVATQIALGDELTPARITVTPILCAIGGVATHGTAGGVHVVDGRGLAALISDRPAILDDAMVQRLARLADARLRQPREWETS